MDDFRQMINYDELTSDDTIALARTAAEAIPRPEPGPPGATPGWTSVGRLRRHRRPVPGHLPPAAAARPDHQLPRPRPASRAGSATTSGEDPAPDVDAPASSSATPACPRRPGRRPQRSPAAARLVNGLPSLRRKDNDQP